MKKSEENIIIISVKGNFKVFFVNKEKEFAEISKGSTFIGTLLSHS